MHKFDIQAGCVTYRNRHLVKEMENYIREYNQPPNLTAYDDPCGSFMGRAFSTFVQAGMLQTQCLCEKRNEKREKKETTRQQEKLKEHNREGKKIKRNSDNPTIEAWQAFL